MNISFNSEYFFKYVYPLFLCILTFLLNFFMNWKLKTKEKLPVLHIIPYILDKKHLLKNKKIYKFSINTFTDISSEEENLVKNKSSLDFEKISINDIKSNMYGFYFKERDKVSFVYSNIEYNKYGKFEINCRFIDISSLNDENIFVCNEKYIPDYFYCNIDDKMYKYKISGKTQKIFYPKRCNNRKIN